MLITLCISGFSWSRTGRYWEQMGLSGTISDIMPLPLRIDANTLPALIFGSMLIAIAAFMALMNRRSRNSLRQVTEHDDPARLLTRGQYRRRMQVCAMLALVGLLIPFGDQMEALFRRRPGLFLVWLGVVMVLVMWIVLMALGDWLLTAAFSATAKAQLRQERRKLEQEIENYRASKNGHAVDGPEASG